MRISLILWDFCSIICNIKRAETVIGGCDDDKKYTLLLLLLLLLCIEYEMVGERRYRGGAEK